MIHVAMNWLTPNLMVEDVTDTIEWYERVLGAETVTELPNEEGDLVWAQLEIDDVSIMVQRRDSLEEELPSIAGIPIGGSFTMYIDVDDVESLADELSDAPRPLAMRTTDYGRREFAIEDPNGYVLWFGESIDD